MSEIVYSSGQAADMFGVNQETIRIWAKEFGRHLSPAANPGKSKHRSFTKSDIEILALVAELKDDGLRFEDIHANLDTGQRGTFPATSKGNPLVGVEAEIALQQIRALERQLAEAERQLEILRSVQDENIRLSAELRSGERERERLEALTKELHGQIRELASQTGEAFARGYKGGFSDGLTADNQQDDT